MSDEKFRLKYHVVALNSSKNSNFFQETEKHIVLIDTNPGYFQKIKQSVDDYKLTQEIMMPVSKPDLPITNHKANFQK